MRVGIFFTPQKSQGGAYQYCVSMVEALVKIPNNQYFIYSVSPDYPRNIFKRKNVRLINLYSKSPRNLYLLRGLISNILGNLPFNFISFIYKMGLFPLIEFLYEISQRGLIALLGKHKLDIIFFPSLTYLSFLVDIPSVVTVYDLGHRNKPKLKEATAGGRWEYREYGLINVSRKAYKIFVDSDTLRENLKRYYKTKTDKIVVLPYIPPSYLNTKIITKREKSLRKKLNLPDSYIFYPAKFWPHKNHINLIKAVKQLRIKHTDVRLILTGSKAADYSTFEEVMKFIKKNNLEKDIIYLGYVNNEELSIIYKYATAMVMPTLLGPTNIPVYEAWAMGTPVLYSDIAGCREQLGNAGLLINPKNPKDIADGILKVYTSPKLRKDLTRKGRERLKLWDNKDFEGTIAGVLKDFNDENVSRNN